MVFLTALEGCSSSDALDQGMTEPRGLGELVSGVCQFGSPHLYDS